MAEAVCSRCGAIFEVTKIRRREDGTLTWTQAPSTRHGMHHMVHQICPVRHGRPDGPPPSCPHEGEAVGQLVNRLVGVRR